ncbi:MAG: addiction module protein [Chromatiales bacterium]|nr:addiction module protein [Chromatiales bacterium]
MNAQLLDQALHLSIDERIELAEALWNSVLETGAEPDLSAQQRDELDRRIADMAENPDDGVSWEAAKAAALARIRK